MRLAAVARTVSLPLPRAAVVARGSHIAMRESRSEERTLISLEALCHMRMQGRRGQWWGVRAALGALWPCGVMRERSPW